MKPIIPPSPVKNQILNTSFAAFNSQGYKAVTMDLVAKELRISKKTIYKHFSSKEEILISGMEVNFERLASKLDKISSKHAEESILRIAAIYRGFLRVFSPILHSDIREHLPHLEERVNHFEQKTIFKAFNKQLKTLRSQKEIVYTLPTRELTIAFFAMIKGLSSVSKDKADYLTSTFYTGICFRGKKKKK